MDQVAAAVDHTIKDPAMWMIRLLTCREPWSPVMVRVAVAAVSTNRSPVSLVLADVCSSILCAAAGARSAPVSHRQRKLHAMT